MIEEQNVNEIEEDICVFVEFDDSINIEKYGNVHVLGIDTKNPILQLDDTFFSGVFENPLGTYMFFDEDLAAKTNDPLFDKLPDNNLKYFLKTRKYIKAEHVYVKQKDGIEKDNEDFNIEKDEKITPVTFTTTSEAVDKFKKEWKTSYPDVFKTEK